MKVVILAGGYGTRLSEETSVRPKPMVEIGNQPMLWHIMKIYSSYGFNEFVICLGYKGYIIKKYFADYFLRKSDVTFDVKNNKMQVHNNGVEPWKVSLIETGDDTMTGGRLKRVRDYLDDDTFCLTYGDGVCDININELVKFHKNQGASATLTAVQPPGRYGVFKLGDSENRIQEFREKPQGDGAWINGGFFVLEPEVVDYIKDDSTVWELEPLKSLAHDGKLSAFKHTGFWQSMDTLRDKNVLEDLWNSPKPPWKLW